MAKHQNLRRKCSSGSLHPSIIVLIIVATFGICLATTATMQGQAQETSANFSPGSVKIGVDTRTCNGSLAGSLRYISSEMQYCDGANWKITGKPSCTEDLTTECVLAAPRSSSDAGFIAANVKDGVNILGVTGSYTGSGLCSAPPLCPNVGDVCDDSNGGTTNDPIFAGCANYGGTYATLFVTDNNQSTSSQWKIVNGTDDIATDHFDDGELNDAQVPNSTTFLAFKLCKDLTDGGFSDWYLPARNELDVLWQNQTAINANAAGNFTVSEYWSSTEVGTSSVWYEIFGNGRILSSSKTNYNYVRCVRRD